MPTKSAAATSPATPPGRMTPFSGVKVIDISNFLAAPMSAMFLADFGAEVIKIERPGTGDEVRYWGRNKNGVGLYYKVDRPTFEEELATRRPSLADTALVDADLEARDVTPLLDALR